MVEAGRRAIAEGEDLVDIETSKITNVLRGASGGTLRRLIAQPGETLPVGALIGVVAEAGVSDADVDAFIAEFQANFTPGDGDEEGAGALAISRGRCRRSHSIRVGRAGEGDDPPSSCCMAIRAT